ncbi:MAG TPA: hypothetical protein VMJ65_24135 [Solirubrobacteraceae bacterium]|nr:hypothetical protein [Solirubrobacteraceae bacterium]
MPVFVAAVAALTAFVASRRWRRRPAKLPAKAVIVSPAESTVIARDGAVRSAQSAELTLAQADFKRMWNATHLENLARTYWLFLSRVTAWTIRVIYDENQRSVVFLGRPLTLLRFDAPQYEIERDHGKVSWRIRDGLLVARSGRGCGFLSLDVRHVGDEPDGRVKVRIEVEVANFYPAISVGFSTPVYEATQSAIHVLVTHAFLRSLATLDLAPSKVGRFAAHRPDVRAAASAAIDRARHIRNRAQH